MDRDGTWDRILDEVIVKDASLGRLEWILSVDSSVVRHTSMPLAPGKRGCATGWVEALAVDGEAIGRSRGGLSSKIHLAVDGRGLPMRTILTAGQAGDNPQLLPLLDGISINRPGPGRPAADPTRRGPRRQGLRPSLDP